MRVIKGNEISDGIYHGKRLEDSILLNGITPNIYRLNQLILKIIARIQQVDFKI